MGNSLNEADLLLRARTTRVVVNLTSALSTGSLSLPYALFMTCAIDSLQQEGIASSRTNDTTFKPLLPYHSI